MVMTAVAMLTVMAQGGNERTVREYVSVV